jgi:putative zinc finger/helix-turn-helix YgiT family protein
VDKMAAFPKDMMQKDENNLKVRECYECHGEMRATRQNYYYTECGLQSVVLMNILVFHCTKCSAIVPEIPAVGWLHRSISWDLLHKKTLLSGEEIKFIRKVAGYSATELASVMGISKVTVSRWETGAKGISKELDRLLRLICFTKMVEQMAGETPDPQLAVSVVRLARAYKSLNITNLLEGIENIAAGPKSVRIDPSKLAAFGESLSSLPETGEFIQ